MNYLAMPVVNYDWDELEDNIVEEYDDAGATIADYTTEPDHFGNVISQHRGGQSSFFHYDGQGSTLAVTDEDQNVTDTRAYSAFGETAESAGDALVPFQYSGQKGYYRDGLTGQYLVRRRPYEPAKGRWSSPDPVPLRFASVNKYEYGSNAVLMATDPSGLIVADIGCHYHIKDEFIAKCELHRGSDIWTATMPCLSTPEHCCSYLESPYYGMTPWRVKSAALYLHRTWKLVCRRGGPFYIAPPVALAVQPAPQPCPVAVGPGAVVQVIVVAGTSLIPILPIFSPGTGTTSETTVEEVEVGKKCHIDFPGYQECYNYDYQSKNDALRQCFGPNAGIDKTDPATECGDGGGWHYRVRDKKGKGVFLGTIICCRCCETTPAGAVFDEKCNCH
jgi:RHS repeat-associated protein